MNWKTWATAMSLGVALTAAGPSANAFDRKDGSTTSAVITDPSIDIVDLYTWMEPTPPTSAGRLYIALTVNPDATKANTRFSKDNLYVIHTNARAAANDTSPAAEIPIICKFDGNATQGFECWAGTTEYLKAKVNAMGQSSTSGKLMVFAGPRNDPFFMNETSLNAAMTSGNTSIQGVLTARAVSKDVAGCLDFTMAESTAVRNAMSPAGSMDSYATKNVLAIVISIDPGVLVTTNKKILSVWASTNKPL